MIHYFASEEYYLQVTHPGDPMKTTFATGHELWQLKVVPFGLCNTSVTFEHFMETMISCEAYLVYLDDFIIIK